MTFSSLVDFTTGGSCRVREFFLEVLLAAVSISKGGGGALLIVC